MKVQKLTNMRFLFCGLLVFIISNNSDSQDLTNYYKNYLGISSNIKFWSFFEGKTKTIFIEVPHELIEVNLSPHVITDYNLTFTYHRYLSKKFKFITGIRFSDFTIHNYFKPVETYEKEKLRTLSIPFSLRRMFKRDFFTDLGIVLDFDLNKNLHSFTEINNGIGFTLAGGKEFKINKLSIEISPNLELHSVLPFKYDLYNQKLIVIGINLGILYGIK